MGCYFFDSFCQFPGKELGSTSYCVGLGLQGLPRDPSEDQTGRTSQQVNPKPKTLNPSKQVNPKPKTLNSRPWILSDLSEADPRVSSLLALRVQDRGLGAEYPSPKKVNLLSYSRIYKPQKVNRYVLSP